MGHTITLAALGAVACMVLDGVWLGVLMKRFYRDSRITQRCASGQSC